MVPTAFAKTLRALDRERPAAAILRFAVALAILAALGWWMARVPVALFEITSEARLEIDTSATVVQAPITGKVVQADVALGKTVRAGDVLVRFDALPEQLQVRQEEARMTALRPEIDALNVQIAADKRPVSMNGKQPKRPWKRRGFGFAKRRRRPGRLKSSGAVSNNSPGKGWRPPANAIV